MSRARAAEVLAVTTLATIITLVIAAPVLRAPSERLFGMELVGRHHDPFTMMAQFDRAPAFNLYSQPVTDLAGSLLARIAGPVAALNWLVLLSFPLSAAAAYLLGRHLALSPPAAAAAALAYAFSPFHLAHAAYHPHIAQTQWVPLYFFALWRCLDDTSFGALALLAGATAAVTLSNFYGGLIAAVMTPVALIVYWSAVSRKREGSLRRVAATAASLLLLAAAGAGYAAYAAGGVLARPDAYAFPRADLFRYSANWWSYLVPPAAHPVVGHAVQRMWVAAGVREGLVEQQVSVGSGVIALALLAVAVWAVRRRTNAPDSSTAGVPVLAAVALAALICSLPPARSADLGFFVRPATLLYDIVPMFRSYARFGLVVQLMAALLAGVGVDYLLRNGARRGVIVCCALVSLAGAEYVVSPRAMWRDVLPTRAHRWVARVPGPVTALDCAPLTQESASITWLTGGRVSLLGGAFDDCTEPDLGSKLAANGYTHVIVRRGSVESPLFDDHAPPRGLRVAARFADGRVFAVTAGVPQIYTAMMTGFLPREYDGLRSWRWMRRDAAWTIVNTGARPISASLELELAAFGETRRLDVLLDGRRVGSLVIDEARGTHELGPITVSPGQHRLAFQPGDSLDDAATARTAPRDPRPLTAALGTWCWTLVTTPDVTGGR